MTPAERQQKARDKRKRAGLVNLNLWVPADKLQAVKDAVAAVVAKPLTHTP